MLDKVTKKQDKLEEMINEQNGKIDEILSKLEGRDDAPESGKKLKDKGKMSKNEFYHVSICFNIIYFIYVIFILIINLIYFKGLDPKIVSPVIPCT
jgi:t-SNARE complex subunit (syntaxin)